MEKKNFESLSECKAAISMCELMGAAVPEWLREQEAAFLAKAEEREAIATSETPIYDTLKLEAKFPLTDEKRNCIESTVENLLKDGPCSEEPGLLLGKIQCGKTDTFENIIGLSFDRGIDIAVVLTKGTNFLVNQTIKRLKRDFHSFKPTDDLNQRAKINIHDIMDIHYNGLQQAEVNSCKTVIVCKKEKQNMLHLLRLFSHTNPFLREKRVLIVDDEADFVSRNYLNAQLQPLVDENGLPALQGRELEMARVAQKIDDFRKMLQYCRYLQVTATPYCLYLQPKGSLYLQGNRILPFRPRFTSLVPIHDKYIGGKQYFEASQDPDSMYSHLYCQVDNRCLKILGHVDRRYVNNVKSSQNLYSLTYAITAYMMATAIRRIQQRAKDLDYKSSAVVHAKTTRDFHDWEGQLITRVLKDIKGSLLGTKDDVLVEQALTDAYNDFKESTRKGIAQSLISEALPSESDTLSEMRQIFADSNYCVQIVNSDNQMVELLDENTGELKLKTAANIFIGAFILDRGITIKNMLCFFYGRDPRSFQQDTVLQHARMYGARDLEDMAVTRFHTTDNLYRVLRRINDLDEQLREWFVAGRDKEEPNAVFVGYDSNIKPCAAQRIKASSAVRIKEQQRLLPVGLWTGDSATIGATVSEIDSLIKAHPQYAHRDADGFFEMSYDEVSEIVNLIRSTYKYGNAFGNLHHKADIQELLAALKYCTEQSDGKVWVLHRTDRNASRIRANGNFIDAPDDGHTDLAPSRLKAINRPVIMLIRENGKRENGWNGTPFYWPVLLTQQNINKAMFAIAPNQNQLVAVSDYSDMLDGIDESEVLKLTIMGDLVDHFGEAGTEYAADDAMFETRLIKPTTVKKYLECDENDNYVLADGITLADNQGVYTLNNGVFPFVPRPYKYLLLFNRRDAYADVMLLELHDPSTWETTPVLSFSDAGDLIDDNGNVLVVGRDTLVDSDGNRTVVQNDNLCVWQLGYRIKRVVKVRLFGVASDDTALSA